MMKEIHKAKVQGFGAFAPKSGECDAHVND